MVFKYFYHIIELPSELVEEIKDKSKDEKIELAFAHCFEKTYGKEKLYSLKYKWNQYSYSYTSNTTPDPDVDNDELSLAEYI